MGYHKSPVNCELQRNINFIKILNTNHNLYLINSGVDAIVIRKKLFKKNFLFV